MQTAIGVAETVGSFVSLAFIIKNAKPGSNSDNRRALAMFCGASFVGSLGIILFTNFFPDANHFLTACLYLVLVVGLQALYATGFVVIVDLFPTILTATVIGMCSLVGRGVAIEAPIVAKMQRPIPMVIVTIFAAICTGIPFAFVRIDKTPKHLRRQNNSLRRKSLMAGV